MNFLIENTWFKNFNRIYWFILFVLIFVVGVIAICDRVIKKNSLPYIKKFQEQIKLNKYEMTKEEIKANLALFKVKKETKHRLIYHIQTSLFRYDEYIVVFSLDNKAIDIHYNHH
ncbi:MAG: hypothetical protein PUA56_04890 [Bacillales bacterium]|nr:hypothetical protein [Bacillales bacterium]